MEINDYVRTKDGMIYKNYGEGENYFEEIIYVSKDHCPYDSIKKDNISKASFNLIDLIEIGDYVNGSKVIDIRTDEELEIGVESDNLIYHYIQNKDIKSVLTKEQF